MDLIRSMERFNMIVRCLMVVFVAASLISMSWAIPLKPITPLKPILPGGSGSGSGASGGLTDAMMSMCSMAKTMLGLGVMLLIILAGTIYAVGQILGAETRARASVWATAMLTGALIGIIIYIITPVIVSALLSGAPGAGATGAVSVTC